MNRPFNITRESYNLDISVEGFFSKMLRKLDDKLFRSRRDYGDEILTFDITIDKEEEYDVDELWHRTPFYKAFVDLIVKHSNGDPGLALVYEGPARLKDIQRVIDAANETIEKFKEWKKDLGKQRRKPYTVDSAYLDIVVGVERNELRRCRTMVHEEVSDDKVRELYKSIDNHERAYNDFCKSLTKFVIKREKK